MDANISFFMLLGGTLLSYIEFLRPGWVLPGALGGAISMLGLSRLIAAGLSIEGLGVFLMGAALLVLEARLHSKLLRFTEIAFGLGTFLMVWGGCHLVKNGLDPTKVEWAVVPFAFITLLLLRTAFRARRNKTTV
jgi:membrane-bound ClpP family serine protease